MLGGGYMLGGGGYMLGGGGYMYCSRLLLSLYDTYMCVCEENKCLCVCVCVLSSKSLYCIIHVSRVSVLYALPAAFERMCLLCVCVRARVRVCVCVCVHACVRACVRACE